MRVIYRISIIIGLAILLVAGGLVLWFYSGIGLPKLSSLKEYKAAQNSQVFASAGEYLTELHSDENREIISLEKIPVNLQNAVVAIEDVEFYNHRGINWKRVVGALWANVVKGEVVQGGSTITQQYVKNAYVGPKRTLWRKIQEASLAYQLEKKYSKDKILELYLNDIYFGQGCYGCYTAAGKYFGKTPPQLTLSESATLAGVISSPSYYDPYQRPQAVLERRNIVLEKMEKQKYITHDEAVAAAAEPLEVMPPNQVYEPPPAPYFCDYITELVRSTYGDQQAYRGGLRIYTTLDMNLQREAEAVVGNLTKAGGPDAALVCIDPRTGYIKAMVGGRDFTASQFNVAADGHRQAGSSFKVFVLARALADGISPEQTYDSSSPRTINLPEGGVWKVNNYDGHGSGSMTIKSATIHSVNVVFAQLIMDVGPSRVATMAKQMGIMTDVESNPAIALGGLHTGVTPLEMASAFGTLANGGLHAVPRSVYKITDAQGNLVVENKPEAHQVLDEKVVEKANEILQSVVSSGTGTGARIGRPQAGKTGTTEDHADAWFVGYTPDLVTAVWVGYPEGRISMGGMTGGSLPATIWREFMSTALKDTPPTAFASGEATSEGDEEDGNVTVTICDESWMLATVNCPRTHSETFRRGEEPMSQCTVHKNPTAKTVPNVIGMGQSSAESTITGSGYLCSIVQAASNEPSGTVLAQTPAAGTQLAAGATVTITVSAGPQMLTVPSVVGMMEPDAKTRLASAGFGVSVSYAPGPQIGIVISQSPAPGSSQPAGTAVAITVTQAPGTGGLSLIRLSLMTVLGIFG